MSDTYFSVVSAAGRSAWGWVTTTVEELGDDIADVASTAGENLAEDMGERLAARLYARFPLIGLIGIGACSEEREIDGLIDNLTSDSVETRIEATHQLLDLFRSQSSLSAEQEARIVPPLLNALNDENQEVRRYVSVLLVREIGLTNEILAGYANVMRTGRREVQLEAATTLTDKLINFGLNFGDNCPDSSVEPDNSIIFENSHINVSSQLRSCSVGFDFSSESQELSVVDAFIGLESSQAVSSLIMRLVESGIFSTHARALLIDRLIDRHRILFTIEGNGSTEMITDNPSGGTVFSARGQAADQMARLANLELSSEQKDRMIELVAIIMRESDYLYRTRCMQIVANLAGSELTPDQKESLVTLIVIGMRDRDISWPINCSVRSAAMRVASVLIELQLSQGQNESLITPLIDNLNNEDCRFGSEARIPVPYVPVPATEPLSFSERARLTPSPRLNIDQLMIGYQESRFDSRAANALNDLVLTNLSLESKFRIIDALASSLRVTYVLPPENGEAGESRRCLAHPVASTNSLNNIAGAGVSFELQERVVADYINLLNDQEALVRSRVASAMAGLNTPMIAPELRFRMLAPLMRYIELDESNREDGQPDHSQSLSYPSGCFLAIFSSLFAPEIPVNLKQRMINSMEESLSNSNFYVQRTAVMALGDLAATNLPDEEKARVVTILLNVLQGSYNYGVRAQAATELRTLGEGSSISSDQKARMVEPLLSALQASNVQLCRRAAQALSVLAASNISQDSKNSMINPLIVAAGDSDENVRTNARHALAIIQRTDLHFETRSRIEQALGSQN